MHASTFVFTDLRYLHVRITCTHSPLSGYAVVALEDSVQVPGHDAIEQSIEHKEDERKVCWRKVKLREGGRGKDINWGCKLQHLKPDFSRNHLCKIKDTVTMYNARSATH